MTDKSGYTYFIKTDVPNDKISLCPLGRDGGQWALGKAQNPHYRGSKTTILTPDFFFIATATVMP